MNLISVLLLFLFVLFKIKNVESNVDIDLIKSFSEKDNSKHLVTAYICWTLEKRLLLTKTLQKNNFLSSVRDITNGIILDNVDTEFKHLFVVDIDCNNSISILQQANTKKLFSVLQAWLMLSKNPNILKDIQEKYNNIDMYANSNILLAQKVQNNFLIREIYKIDIEYLLNIIGLWTEEDKFQNFRKRVLAYERRNLRRKKFDTCYVIMDNNSMKHLEDYRHIHIDSVGKINYMITKHLIEYLNGILFVYPVNSWGYYNTTAKIYDGVIGCILNNMSELSGSSFFITTERTYILDYLRPTIPTETKFVFRQPPLSYEQNIFTLPFTTALWISSFLLILLLILLLYSAVLWEWKVYDPDVESDVLKNSFMDCAMLTFSAAVQQGSSAEPRSAAGKFIMILILIFFMFLFASYSANIITLLQAPSSNIRSLEDLLHSKLKVGADDVVYNKFFLSNTSEPVRRALYEKKIVPPGEQPHYMSLKEGVNLIRQGYFAFHMELGSGYKVVADTFYEDEKCGLQEIDFIGVSSGYLVAKKNSTLKEIFKLGLGRIKETGIQSRQISRIYTSKPKCLSSGASFSSIGITELQPAFTFFAVGLILSLLLLILEISFSKKTKSNKFCSTINYK